MLAEDWDVSADGTEWTFRLRDGVEFHDGSTLSSADVLWQFQRVLDEATGSAGLSILSPVLDPSGITAPDPTTIRFKLKAPDAFFGVKAAHYTLRIPKAETSDWLAASFGTGPFKSVSFKPGEGFEFERNPNYWMDGLPLLDGIVGVSIPEQSTRAQAVLTGDVDVADRPSVSAMPQFEESDEVGLFPTDPQAYTFDIDSSIKPFSDPRVSQAMKMLIDRQAMLNLVVRGFGTVSADSLIHPNNALYPSDLEPYPFDPERAKALLAEAGYEAGFTEKAWTTTAYTYLNEGAAFGKEAWAEGDINLEIESVSNDRYLQAFLNEPIVMDYYKAQHPVTMFELYYASTSESNTARYKDPEIDDWLGQLKATTDAALQAELAASIIKRYNERAALICPFHFDDLVTHKTRVTGLAAEPMARLDFRNVAITS
jgi:peptide/nickel transport system substrate-binding protein